MSTGTNTVMRVALVRSHVPLDRPRQGQLHCSRGHTITYSGQPGQVSDSAQRQGVTYALRRSLRARYPRLEVGHDVGTVVIIPLFYEARHVSILLRDKRRWILEKLAKLEQQEGASVAESLGHRDIVPYLGRELALVTRCSRDGREGARLEGNTLVVNSRRETRLGMAMEAWYRIQAARVLEERVMEFSTLMGVVTNRVTIRGHKTRSGSCSGNGNLSFNWRLLTAPPAVIDYAVVHELAHLRELNHSRGFWRLVAEYCPKWREHKKWLREHETELAGGLPW